MLLGDSVADCTLRLLSSAATFPLSLVVSESDRFYSGTLPSVVEVRLSQARVCLFH